MENLRLNNGISLKQKEPNLVTQTEASKSGWETFCNLVSTRGKWSKKEESFYTNVLESIAVKFAILIFTKEQSYIAIHLQIDSKTTFSNLLKIGATHNRELLHISKSIWNYLLSKQFAVSALPVL